VDIDGITYLTSCIVRNPGFGKFFAMTPGLSCSNESNIIHPVPASKRSPSTQLNSIRDGKDYCRYDKVLELQDRDFGTGSKFMHVHEGPSCVGIPIMRLESSSSYNNQGTAHIGSGYEVSRASGGRALGAAEQRLMELRLRWALRRIHERLIIPLHRRCEMRLFLALRMQFLYRRRRSRIRAAITIQKFVRNRIQAIVS